MTTRAQARFPKTGERRIDNDTRRRNTERVDGPEGHLYCNHVECLTIIGPVYCGLKLCTYYAGEWLGPEPVCPVHHTDAASTEETK